MLSIQQLIERKAHLLQRMHVLRDSEQPDDRDRYDNLNTELLMVMDALARQDDETNSKEQS